MLTQATEEICAAWGVRQRLLPMTDDVVTTMVTLADEDVEVPFQEYFVQRRHSVPVSAVRFAGAAAAALPQGRGRLSERRPRPWWSPRRTRWCRSARSACWPG